jgi:UDP-N-acetylmuramoylalanine--D-glutamate ligase
MKLDQLKRKSILVLGLGLEGCSALRFLRREFPQAILAAADQRDFDQLSADARALLSSNGAIKAHLGNQYLTSLSLYDVVVKSPGIPVILPEYQAAVKSGKLITSPTALFFANFPGIIVGVTGTKGKSTTSSLIAAMLKRHLPGVCLVGNIGTPALESLPGLREQERSVVVFELSSHQLEGLRQSPQIAVLLNIVPEHLDYYADFEAYVDAKQNITRFQKPTDYLVYEADHDITRQIAAASPAKKIPCSLLGPMPGGCFLLDDWINFEFRGPREQVARVEDIPLLGSFNRINVAAAVAVARLLDVPSEQITAAVREFRPLEHRLEKVGEFAGINFYKDSNATVPEAAVAALEALGGRVQTVLLGGADRKLSFARLAEGLILHKVENVILFPPTGQRIWEEVKNCDPEAAARITPYFVESMEEGVRLAGQHTAPGRVCLLSPASPSFGLFRDYRERGDRFKQLVRAMEISA